MKERILELLESSSWDDNLLGIILATKENLFDEISRDVHMFNGSDRAYDKNRDGIDLPHGIIITDKITYLTINYTIYRITRRDISSEKILYTDE